jgi:hypothetical protein
MSLQVLISNTDYLKLQNSGVAYKFILNVNKSNVVVEVESLEVLNKAIKSVKLETQASKLKTLKNELSELTDDTNLIDLCLTNFSTNGTTYLTVIQALEYDDTFELNKAVRIMQNAEKRHNRTNYDEIIKIYGKELAREMIK